VVFERFPVPALKLLLKHLVPAHAAFPNPASLHDAENCGQRPVHDSCSEQTLHPILERETVVDKPIAF